MAISIQVRDLPVVGTKPTSTFSGTSEVGVSTAAHSAGADTLPALSALEEFPSNENLTPSSSGDRSP